MSNNFSFVTNFCVSVWTARFLSCRKFGLDWGQKSSLLLGVSCTHFFLFYFQSFRRPHDAFLFIFFFFFLRKYPTKSQAPSCLATAVSAAAVWGGIFIKRVPSYLCLYTNFPTSELMCVYCRSHPRNDNECVTDVTQWNQMMKDYLAQQLHSVILRSVVLVSAESDDQKGESITFFSHHQITRKNSIVVLVG
jgi:hypothetical protein